MFRRRAIAAAAVAAAIAGCSDPLAPPAREGAVEVLRVVDGDTIRVALPDGEAAVRYIGVDTPESVKPDSPVECFARRAAEANRRLVEGRRVRLAYDVERRDRYGRLLAYVYAGEAFDVFVNAELVRGGYATALTVPPNVRHAGRLHRLAARARRDGRGLWSRCRQGG